MNTDAASDAANDPREPAPPLTTLQVLEILGRAFGPIELVAVLPRRVPER